MLDLLLRATTSFLGHFALASGLIVLLALLCYALARVLGWQARGERLPAWGAKLTRVLAWLTIAFSALSTGAQVGGVQVLGNLVEHESKRWALQGLLLAGKPIGIASAEQRIGIADLERLLERLAPGSLAKTQAALDQNKMVEAANSRWQQLPAFLREQINTRVRTEWTLAELVDLGYRETVRPIVRSSKEQALIFAYGLGALLVLLAITIDLAILAWSRSRRESAVEPD